MNIKLLQASVFGYESVVQTNDPEEAKANIDEVIYNYDLPGFTSWQYDQATGEEQQTIFPEAKQEAGKGEFVGDLFNYTEEN